MKFSAITADPFVVSESNLFTQQLGKRYDEILALIKSYSAVSFLNAGTSIICHPSAKTAGRFQLTVFKDGLPLSDTQHDAKESVAFCLLDYVDLEAIEML